MKISGFSAVRNGVKLYYPFIESIKSILPIVDEFVIAVGQSDDGDSTRQKIVELNEPKIKIIDTIWEKELYKDGILLALQTDIAKAACTGDWLFYVQADEVVHEKYLPIIKQRCQQVLSNNEVEGLLFRYKHFWGDYNHYQGGHGWYRNEIRIIRNRENIHSWQDAQSFRSFEFYDNPRQPDGHRKLQVAKVDAEIYHYGWVRPPHLMQTKKKSLDSIYWGIRTAAKYYEKAPDEFDYGPLLRLARFEDAHPKVMEERISSMDWQDKLQYSGAPNPSRQPHKHERLKYRFISFLEKYILRGREIGGFKNYLLVKK